MDKHSIIIIILSMTLMSFTQTGHIVSIGDTLTWRVHECPEVPFEWGWGSGNKWITSNGSIISFDV